MASHHQAVVLEFKRDLIVSIPPAPVFGTNASPSTHEPSIAQNGLTDLVREDDIVHELNLDCIGILQKY